MKCTLLIVGSLAALFFCQGCGAIFCKMPQPPLGEEMSHRASIVHGDTIVINISSGEFRTLKDSVFFEVHPGVLHRPVVQVHKTSVWVYVRNWFQKMEFFPFLVM